jgi:hypothetical protein
VTPASALLTLAVTSGTPSVEAPAVPPRSLIDTTASLRAAPVVAVSGADHGRARWSAEEDAAIEQGVRRFGCRWRQIAQTLPGRSDSSIRNRWARLHGQAGDEAAAGDETHRASPGAYRPRDALSYETAPSQTTSRPWPASADVPGGGKGASDAAGSLEASYETAAGQVHAGADSSAPDEALAMALVAFASQQRAGGEPAQGGAVATTDAAAYSEEGAP